MPSNKDGPVQTQMVVVVLDGCLNSQYHGFKDMDRKQTEGGGMYSFKQTRSGGRRVFVQTDAGAALSIALDRGDNARTLKEDADGA